MPSDAARAARMAASGHGARPRFVWMMTPVALITGAGPAPCSRASRRDATSAPSASGVRTASVAAPSPGPARRARSSSTTARAIARTAAGSRAPASGRAAARTRSTLGGWGREPAVTRRSWQAVDARAARGSPPLPARGRRPDRNTQRAGRSLVARVPGSADWPERDVQAGPASPRPAPREEA